MTHGYPAIGDYGLIGDCRAAGLISRDGSLDWLCFPRFDSPSVFGALVDRHGGGRFQICPSGAFQTTRRYLQDTNILETTFHTATGVVALRDLMPVRPESDTGSWLAPDHQVLREIEALRGEVEMEVIYEPRPEYARLVPRLSDRGALGIWCEANRGAMVLQSEVPLQVASDGASAHGKRHMGAGDRRYLAFTYAEEAPHVLASLGQPARAAVSATARWWRQWASRCTYAGPYRDIVVRSALVLKLMAYAPSGAVIAAPTTSLPEQLGGVRNWDYRYCWLRDASFTLRALFALGYSEEADAFLQWLLHATRLTWPELQVVYDVFGETNLREQVLPHLEGYAGSRPVRIGNDAHGQLQLDVYGAVIDAVSRFVRRGGRVDRDTSQLLNGLGRTVSRRWREPDEGIWEGRSGRSQNTHSKVLCWVALDRLIRMHEAGQVRVSADQLRTARDAIRNEIETRGYNERLGSYTRTLDGDELDASLLVLPLYGYIDGSHPRMRSTCRRIHDKLARGGLVYRYEPRTDDGLPPGEGAFGICSFWAVECRARGGDVLGATRAFEQLLAYSNDLGLLAEEINPETGAALGNFPQAFTHIGLINAALTLADNVGQGINHGGSR